MVHTIELKRRVEDKEAESNIHITMLETRLQCEILCRMEMMSRLSRQGESTFSGGDVVS